MAFSNLNYPNKLVNWNKIIKYSKHIDKCGKTEHVVRGVVGTHKKKFERKKKKKNFVECQKRTLGKDTSFVECRCRTLDKFNDSSQPLAIAGGLPSVWLCRLYNTRWKALCRVSLFVNCPTLGKPPLCRVSVFLLSQISCLDCEVCPIVKCAITPILSWVRPCLSAHMNRYWWLLEPYNATTFNSSIVIEIRKVHMKSYCLDCEYQILDKHIYKKE